MVCLSTLLVTSMGVVTALAAPYELATRDTIVTTSTTVSLSSLSSDLSEGKHLPDQMIGNSWWLLLFVLYREWQRCFYGHRDRDLQIDLDYCCYRCCRWNRVGNWFCPVSDLSSSLPSSN